MRPQNRPFHYGVYFLHTHTAMRRQSRTVGAMGSYDTVIIDGHNEQTKALGKTLSTFALGDTVRAYPAPMNSDELDTWSKGSTPAHPEETFQVKLTQGWAIIINQELTAWKAELTPGLAAFDYLGHPYTGGESA